MRKRAFAAVFFDDGDDFVLDELPRGLADEFFFVVELQIEIDVIHSAVCGHRALPICGSSRALPRDARFQTSDDSSRTTRSGYFHVWPRACPHAPVQRGAVRGTKLANEK